MLLVLFHVFSDGCARQYAGRKNYLRVAQFFQVMGLIMVQHTAQAHCFKGVWDGYGKGPKQGARDAVRRLKATLPTTKPWFEWCRVNKPKPERAGTRGASADDHPEGKTVFGANRYVWVYYKSTVWNHKEFDAIPLPDSKSYLDVKGKITTSAHPSEGTWPLDRRWLACFCLGCQAANAADVASVLRLRRTAGTATVLHSPAHSP